MIKQLEFGVHLPVMGFDKSGNTGMENPHSREQILSIARKAESLGFDSLSVNDHIVSRTSWLDSLSALSAVAAVTNRIKLGTSVLNIVVRNPVISAKSLSAIDIISSGRLFAAGVGPGSHKGDYIAFSDKSNDSFSIGANIYFSDEDRRSIEALKDRAQQQVYMDIRKLVYPTGINCDTRFPTISLHKLIFIDSLKDKQYLFDSVTNLINAMQLVMIRFQELRP